MFFSHEMNFKNAKAFSEKNAAQLFKQCKIL